MIPHKSRDARALLESAAGEDERDLSTLFSEYSSRDSGGLRVIVRQPIRVMRAARTMLRLPRLDVRLTTSSDALAIKARLRRDSGLGRLPLLRGIVDVLPLPADPADYARGRSRQTLRQRTQWARRAGVVWHSVTDPVERRALLVLATELERSHPDAQYRSDEPDNSDFVSYGQWLVAESADGTPLLLVAAAVDGEWALLRYFRTLGHERVHSDTRFLMAGALVEQLHGLGVRYVFNAVTPFTVQPGLRHFQRMLGWRICRLRIRSAPLPSTVESPAWRSRFAGTAFRSSRRRS